MILTGFRYFKVLLVACVMSCASVQNTKAPVRTEPTASPKPEPREPAQAARPSPVVQPAPPSVPIPAPAAPALPQRLATATVVSPPSRLKVPLGAEEIRAASCPKEVKNEPPAELPIDVKALARPKQAELSKVLPKAVRLHGAWQLDADNPNFGGLSGLAKVKSGLLAVSDAGTFYWIDLKEGVPEATARFAYMRGADGKFLQSKARADAEGLAELEGLAFVSFEQTHRVEAFALETCGAAARSVKLADLPAVIDTARVPDNEGAEALWLTGAGQLRFGYEALVGGGGVTGSVSEKGEAKTGGGVRGANLLMRLVSADSFRRKDGSEGRAVLLRGYAPFLGVSAALSWGDGEEERFSMGEPLQLDNFEGMTVEQLSAGSIRVWIISDDNFSASQRTLLYAFDIEVG